MNTATKIILLGFFLLIAFILVRCNNDQKQKEVVVTNESFESSLQEALEKAYFEGQRDALSGDVRIEEVQEHCYRWTSSPWDSGEEPIYKPCPDNN